MAVTTTPLGFKKPDGNELVRGGDNAIADNAQTSQDLIADVRSKLAYVEAAIAAGGTGGGGTGGGGSASNVGLDTDGVPYYEIGASGTTIEADTDGVPFFF